MMLDGFLNAARGRSGRGLWVPGGGGGGGALSTGPGANEPVGNVQVFSRVMSTIPPQSPTMDDQGFTLSSGGDKLSIGTDGVDTWMRATVPAAHCHAGSSIWRFFIEGDDAAGIAGVNVAAPATKWPDNTGRYYSRQRLRFSSNWRMDGSVSMKAWSPRHTRAVSTNNFTSYTRGMAGNAPGDQKAVAPVGQEQTMSTRWTTQTGGVVGTQDFEQSGATWGTSEKRFQSNAETWHEFEFLMEPGTAGGSDWTLSWWIDGVLVWQRTNIPVNNVGDPGHVGEINVFNQFNPTVHPSCTLLNTTDGSGLPGTEWQDQWMDYGYWYGSVEPV